MKKEFYIGQPLIIKGTGERVTFAYDDREINAPHIFVGDSGEYCEYDDLEPSTEFTFSQIIAGLEQGYFEVGTEFIIPGYDRTIKIKQGDNGLYLERFGELVYLVSRDINSTWQLVEPRKEMTLEEIEAELGYKIKLKDNEGN